MRTVSLQDLWDKADEATRHCLLHLDSEPLPDVTLQREELRQLVAATLLQLPDERRSLLESKYIHRHSLEQIASQQGQTIDAVKGRMKRARAAFRECFLKLSKLEVSDV